MFDPPREGEHDCAGYPPYFDPSNGPSRCLVCTSPLTDELSCKLRVGPDCRERDYKHEILARTICGEEVNAVNGDGITRTHLLAQHAGHTGKEGGYIAERELMDWLAKPGVNVEVRDAWGETPLHYAAGAGAIGAVNALVNPDNWKWRANVSAVDNKGNTPAHAAAAQVAFRAMITLAKCGTDMDTQNSYGETPLHLAVRAEAAEIAKAIVEYGTSRIAATADLDDAINHSINAVGIKDKSGATPLHYALSDATAKKLLNCGADASVRDCFGRTPWNYAEQKIAQMEKDVSPKQTEIDCYFGTLDCDNDGKTNARKAVSELREKISALLCPE